MYAAKLTPSRHGVNCDDGSCKQSVRNPWQSGETGNISETRRIKKDARRRSEDSKNK